MTRKWIFLLTAMLSVAQLLFAQQRYSVVNYLMDGKVIKTSLNLDSLEAIRESNRFTHSFQKKNYLFCNYTIESVKDTLNILIDRGEKHEKVNIDSIQFEGSDQFSIFKLNKLTHKVISSHSLNEELEKLIQKMNQSGYPFARVDLIPDFSNSDPWSAQIVIEPGQFVTIDTVIILGNAKLSNSFIKHYLGLGKNDPFDQKALENIPIKIEALNFIELDGIPFASFRKNKAMIYIRVNEREANNINALIGLAPQSYNNENRLLFTGQADIDLHNLTRNRERLELHWNSFLGNSQSLEISLNTPYVPLLNVGLGFDFNLLKFDSNYLQNGIGIKINHLSRYGIQWSIVHQTENTSLLNADTQFIRSNFNFPIINANSRRSYGLQLDFTRWKNLLNPYRGIAISIAGMAGNKKIVRDARIEQVEFTNSNGTFNIYDSLELEFVQYEFTTSVKYAFPLWKKRWVLYQEYQFNHKQAPQLFFNDLYRLGGFTTLRGFDEQSIFASQYFLNNTELRFRVDDFSNVFLFYNLMAYSIDVANYPLVNNDVPQGFGIGANINSNNTIIQIVYAYGKERNRSFSINQGKFHIGLVSYF